MNQEYLLFSDLPGFDSNPEAVQKAFTTLLHERPTGLALNKELYGFASHPPITEKHSKYCYKILADTQYSDPLITSAQKLTIGSETAINHSDKAEEITVTIDSRWDESISWWSSITTGVSFHSVISLEGTFNMGMPFSASIKAGTLDSSIIPRVLSTTITVKVPPKSKIEVNIVAIMRKEKMGFNIPLYVEGYFGGEYIYVHDNSPITDGYAFLKENDVLPKTSGVITGEITGIAAFDITHKIDKAVPL